jgi:hypothetical protein
MTLHIFHLNLLYTLQTRRHIFRYIFRRAHKIAKSDSYLLIMSVCSHGSTLLSLGGFSLNLIFENFSKNLSRKFEIT